MSERWSDKAVICPHCEHEHRDTSDFESESGETDCDKCDRPFVYSVHVSYSYTTRPVEAT